MDRKERKKAIIKAFMGNKLQRDIAEEVGASQQYVSKVIRAFINRKEAELKARMPKLLAEFDAKLGRVLEANADDLDNPKKAAVYLKALQLLMDLHGIKAPEKVEINGGIPTQIEYVIDTTARTTPPLTGEDPTE